MAKYRHRIFEMYDFADEAIEALTPRIPRAVNKKPEAPQSWTFRHLRVSETGVVTHVQITEAICGVEMAAELRADLTQLGERLARDSKLLLDFSGVTSCDESCRAALAVFNKKLQNIGSRMVLCSLAPAVRESFFADRTP